MTAGSTNGMPISDQSTYSMIIDGVEVPVDPQDVIGVTCDGCQ